MGSGRVVYGGDMDLIVSPFDLGPYLEADPSPEEERLVTEEKSGRVLHHPSDNRCQVVSPGGCNRS